MRLGSLRWLSAVTTAPGSVRYADPSPMLSSARMFKDLLGAIWRRIPKPLRRWSMRATHTRFTVTAAGFEQSMEVDRAVWFPPNSLPEGLPADQQELIKRAVTNGAKGRD